MVTKKTIEEWGQLTNITVLDPDGFNRRDRSLHIRKFTLGEFITRAAHSTCRWKNGSIALMDGVLELVDDIYPLQTREVIEARVEFLKKEIPRLNDYLAKKAQENKGVLAGDDREVMAAVVNRSYYPVEIRALEWVLNPKMGV